MHCVSNEYLNDINFLLNLIKMETKPNEIFELKNY